MTLKEFERGLREETYNRYRQAAQNAQNENDAQMYNRSADMWGRAFWLIPREKQEPVTPSTNDVAQEHSRYIPQTPSSSALQKLGSTPEHTIRNNYTPPSKRAALQQIALYTPYEYTDRDSLMAYLAVANAVKNGDWERGKQLARDCGIDFNRALSTISNGWEYSRNLSDDLGVGMEAFQSKYDSILNNNNNNNNNNLLFERDPYLDAINEALIMGKITQEEYEKALRSRQEDSDAETDIANIIASRNPNPSIKNPKTPTDGKLLQEIKLSEQDAKAIDYANGLSSGRYTLDEYNKALGITYPKEEPKQFVPNVEYKASLEGSSDNKNGAYGYTPTGEYVKSSLQRLSKEGPVGTIDKRKTLEFVRQEMAKERKREDTPVPKVTIKEPVRTDTSYKKEPMERKEKQSEDNKTSSLSKLASSATYSVADFKRAQDTIPTTYVGYHRNSGDNFPNRAKQEIDFIYRTGTSQDSPNISNQLTHGEWSARTASAKQHNLGDYKLYPYSHDNKGNPEETVMNNVRAAHNRYNDESWGVNQCTVYSRALAKSSNLKNWNEVKNDTVDTYLNMKNKGLIVAEYNNTKGDNPNEDNQQDLRNIATNTPGLLVFWNTFDEDFVRTDDPEDDDPTHALRGITHVGVTLGNGLVAQSGSGGIRSIPVGMYRIEALGNLRG